MFTFPTSGKRLMKRERRSESWRMRLWDLNRRSEISMVSSEAGTEMCKENRKRFSHNPLEAVS